MSLIHWWPLNGNTTDLGISPCTVSVSDTLSFAANGKIGKCLSGGTLTMPAAATAQAFNKDAVSVCFWLYNGGHGGCIFGTDGMTPPNNRRFSLYQYPDANDLHWSWQNEDSSGTFTSGVKTGVLARYAWSHICAVWDNGTARIYVNGAQVGTSTGTCASTNWAYDTIIARPNNLRYYNDIRIYNHALSAKEVKEISKGLVLHYNFEDACSNLIPVFSANPELGITIDNSTHPFNLGPIYKISQSGNTSKVYRGLSYAIPNLKAGDVISMGCWIYTEDKSSLDSGSELRVYQEHNDGSAINWNGINWLATHTDGKWCYYSRQYTLDSNLSSAIFNVNVVKNGTFWITGIKVEYGSTTTPFDGYKEVVNTIYDNSGYGYNGTVAGKPQIISDSTIGKHSMYSPSGANYVERQNFPVAGFNTDQQFTINAWIKIVGYNGSSWNTIFRLAANNAKDTQMHLCYNSSGKIILSQYSDDPQFTLNVPLNTWAMVTWVHYLDGSTAKCQYFVNGQQVGSTQSYSGLLNIKDNARLTLFYDSIRRNYDSDLYIGDFKIYSTVLSAEDILAEYNRKAAIDKKDNIFTGEFIETNTNANIADKNNQIKATYFVEGKDKVKIFGGYTELDYFDQINPAAGATSQHNRCTISDISYDHIEARVNVTGQGSSGGIVFSNGMWWKTYTGRGNVNDGSGTVTMTPASFSQNIWTDVSWDFSKVFSVLWTSGWSDGINYWTPQNLKVAYIKTYIGSELTGHFIPVKNKNNVIGLFNLITNKFYSNTGTGTESFVAGNSLGKLSLIQENKIEEL